MRKILFFVFSIVLAAVVLISPEHVSAQVYEDGTVEVNSPDPSLMPENSTTESGKVNYELPYPGMLPDNPFYFLKMLRDKVVKTLISDPLKKAQFNLLTAQKRMYAGKLLADKKKYDLSLDTIEKSNNYLDDALKDIEQAKKENPKSTDIRPFLDQFRTVNSKHKEILSDLKPIVGSKNLKRLEWQETRIENTNKTVETHLKEKH